MHVQKYLNTEIDPYKEGRKNHDNILFLAFI